MEVLPATEWPRLAPVWRELVQLCPEASYFLETAWIETWLSIFGAVLDVSIAVFHSGVDPVAICLLVKSTRRMGGVPWRRISLNASGEPSCDTTYVEYNTLLCREGWETVVAGKIADYLSAQGPDEVSLDGFCPGPAYEALRRALRNFSVEETWQPSCYVDLHQIKNSAGGFESTLGHTTRKHLRQNIRRYSDFGPLKLEAAANIQTALEMLDELARLNLCRWQTRSARPVFASKRFLEFHRALITRSVSDGSVELLRLSAGEQTLGIVYHLVHNRTVYLYQCGLNYAIDPRLSPGTVTLVYAIQRALDSGAACFDFLAGTEPYKERLSTSARRLVWAAFRKPGPKTRLYEVAKAVRRATRRIVRETN